MSTLSEPVRRVLEAAGWSEARSVATRADEDALARDGYSLSRAARAFLERYSGLEVSFRHPADSRIRIALRFDAARGAASVYPERVAALSSRAGSPLVPVGTAHGGNMVLLVDPRGRVLVASDDILILMGETSEEALEALATGRSGVAIP